MKKLQNLAKMTNKYIDIGANLTDTMFRGIYNSKEKHEPDLDNVLDRAWNHNVEKIIITVGSYFDADEAIKLANTDDRLFTTMGIHPTNAGEFSLNPEEHYSNVQKKIAENVEKIVAIGECGLDFDRTHFCAIDIQKEFFEKQLDLVQEFKLPLFLHCRKSHKDFIEILERNREKIFPHGGVVHSFDGTAEEAQKILDFGLYIGLNGCSMKTEDNLKVIKEIPNDRILLETDAPWCGIRPSHASSKFVKTKFSAVKNKEKWTPEQLVDGRFEPCQIGQLLEIIAAVKEEPIKELADIYYQNTVKLFFNKKN